MTAQTNEDKASNVMKELSDIKSSLAVNTSETSNIKNSISEIKADIREIKGEFVTRREMKDAIDTVKEEIIPLRRFIYGIITALGLTILGAIGKLVLK